MLTAIANQTSLCPQHHAFKEHLEHLRDQHPDLAALLKQDPVWEAEQETAGLNNTSWEFEEESVGGRGPAYNSAQKCVDNRQVGMVALLKCFSPDYEIPGRDVRILDVLGGDGTLARFCKSLGRPAPTIYTGDVSQFMIDACRAQGLPCLRQSATRSYFRDGVLDGVLIAYGSHHLSGGERLLAVREAHRTLKAGGRLVLHDFETGGRSARWFESVVHRYSRTGHPHAHFSRHEMRALFRLAGFADIRIIEIPDPFTLRGASPSEARRNALMHIYRMYDLIKIPGSANDLEQRLERHIADTLGAISVRTENDHFVAEIPRQALVAVGMKRNNAPDKLRNTDD